MEITYTLVGDYFLPNIALSDPPEARPLGYFGRLCRAHLKEHKPVFYNQLLLTERLFPYLRELDIAAQKRRECGMSDIGIVAELFSEE
jgi:hypothetical protein